ncbi:hypothetical protein FOC89_00530 (plasmid) [Bacillus thuringiensis]|uniref:Uncharacterized protein n=1 Tax=Bacillus thuringiensis TaxID=1428 RepID=A0A0B5NBF8_BACTU|nr:hypothetical protein [Bacillus thuringiensis]AJG73730.1 hypothetical protein BF38_6232 [Bacillus thuringiensis]EEM74279.1 hypothetical protein bthur0010_57710 [Bacillus thuringiensis serovar pondicheriensis BGSC 4BA1]OTX54198.1 hypothetical protein BK723_10775 [Bacillus thuringiensis serovar pondicheriensis]QKH22504.1 hypothetical protein FOC89_00530 [Bacillus thuringiensis]
MFKRVKEWLFEYTYTKYLVELKEKEHNSYVSIDLGDQLSIIKLLKYLGAQKCQLEVYQRPIKELFDLSMSDLQITSTSIIISVENNRKFELNYKLDGHATISLIDAETMVFELSESISSRLFYIKWTVSLPFTIEHIIEESKRLSREHRENKEDPIEQIK